MSVCRKAQKPDQRTLNHYFAAYQPPNGFGARSQPRRKSPPPRQVQPSGQHEAELSEKITTTPAVIAPDNSVASVPDIMGSRFSKAQKSPAQNTTTSNPPSESTATRSDDTSAPKINLDLQHIENAEPNSTISVKRRKVSLEDNDDVIVLSGESTPRPSKRVRSSEPQSPARASPTHPREQIARQPSSSELSTLTSLGSTPPLSFPEKPIYVPSSQSDENYDLELGQSNDAQPDRLNFESSDILEAAKIDDASHKESKSYALSDSDSSLSSIEDLATILGRGRAKRTTRPKIENHSAFKPNPKFSLANLKRQHDRDVAANTKMQNARAILDQDSDLPMSEPMLDKSTLKSIVGHNGNDDEEHHVDKVMLALDRAEVMGTSIAWHFFNPEFNSHELGLPAFPNLEGQLSKYALLFEEEATRQSTFLSGFAEEIFSGVSLPRELRLFLWRSALVESNQHLAHSYISALQAAKRSDTVDADEIPELFTTDLDAKFESLDLEAEILPTRERAEAPLRNRLQQLQRLHRVLFTFEKLSDFLSDDARTYAISVFIRLAIDSEITKDLDIQIGLKNSITALVSSYSDESWMQTLSKVGRCMLQTLTNPILQSRLVSFLPASIKRTHDFRRQLASAFFLASSGNQHDSPFPQSISSQTPVSILSRLRNSSLYIADPRNMPNYTELAASIAILDIAIDSGFPVASSPVSTPPTTVPRNIFPTAKPPSPHDAMVDQLTDTLRAIFARIMDTGATHMARTEAKGVLERLLNRLEYSVRSRPRPRKTAWDAEVDEGGPGSKRGAVSRASSGGWRDSGAALMESFVSRRAGLDAKLDTDGQGDLEETRNSDSEDNDPSKDTAIPNTVSREDEKSSARNHNDKRTVSFLVDAEDNESARTSGSD